MMQFYEPNRFLFLLLIPFISLILWSGQKLRKRRLAQMGDPDFFERRLMPGFMKEARKRSFFLMAGCFIFATLALARPQWGNEKKEIQRKGVDLIFLLDTSLSMLAEDIKPSRLGKARLEIKTITRKLKGDRVGMVAFAGTSFLQSPLTLDYSAFFMFVDALKPGYIPIPGTSLSHAIQLALKAFPEESRKYRALVIFSDGEDHEGRIEEAIAEAKKQEVRIYTFGTGTLEGEPIPLRAQEGNAVTAYKKDRAGNVVVTRLNEELLARMGEETGGVYFRVSPSEKEIDLLLKHLETLGQRQLKSQIISEREDHYQVFLGIAFLMLISETFLMNTRKAKEYVIRP